MLINELSREELIEIVTAQAVFTHGLRAAANKALAHANHLVSNYASDVPADKMKDWAEAQIEATALLVCPAPVSDQAAH